MKTTAAHFKIFKAAVEAMIERLGLTDWKVIVWHNRPPDKDNEMLAWVRYNHGNRIASISLAHTWEFDPISWEALREVAKHEVLHVLLADLTELGTSHGAPADAFAQAEHAVIRRLEKLL